MVANRNDIAMERMYDHYRINGTPHVMFDGGVDQVRGLPDQPVNFFGNMVADMGAAPVSAVGLEVSLDYVGSDQLDVTVTLSPPGGSCCLQRGDVDRSGGPIDIADLVFIVSYMFQGGEAPSCLDELDMDGSGGVPDIADVIHLVNYMFQSGPPPVVCP